MGETSRPSAPGGLGQCRGWCSRTQARGRAQEGRGESRKDTEAMVKTSFHSE